MILENAAEYNKLQLNWAIICSRNALIGMIIVISIIKFNVLETEQTNIILQQQKRIKNKINYSLCELIEKYSL